MLIAILSITDIGMSLVGVIFFPTNLSSDGVWGRKFCHAQGTLYAFLSMTTFFILGLITYDRCEIRLEERSEATRRAPRGALMSEAASNE